MLKSEIKLVEGEEADIRIIFPNGRVIELQYRLEAPSIDVCLPEELTVTAWQGDDMEPARSAFDAEHIRFAKQLVLDFPPDWAYQD